MNDTLNNTAASGGDLSSGITVGQTMGQQEAVNMATGQTGWQANEHLGSNNTGDFIAATESSIAIPEETKTNDDKYGFITDAFEVVTKPFQALNDTIEDWHKKKPQSKTLAEGVFGKENSDKLEYSMNGLGTKENPLAVPKAEKTELQKMNKPEDYHIGKKVDIEKTDIPKISNGQPDADKSQSASFYDEENTYEGVSKETDRMMNANSRPRERVISNGGDISAVAKYIDSLPESERLDAFHKLGKEYYLAGAGDIRAGLTIFGTTGDIIGGGTSKRLAAAMEALQNDDAETAEALLDPNNVKVGENLKSALWTNNPANKAVISTLAGEIIAAASGAALSKAAEKFLPKIIDKVVQTAVDGKGASQKVAEKIVTSLSKNKNVVKAMERNEQFENMEFLWKSGKNVEEAKSELEQAKTLARMFGKKLSEDEAVKEAKNVLSYAKTAEKSAYEAAKRLGGYGSGEILDIPPEQIATLVKDSPLSFAPEFTKSVKDIVANGGKDVLVTAIADQIADSLKGAGKVVKPAAAAAIATAIVEKAHAGAVMPRQTVITETEAPTAVSAKMEDITNKVESVDDKQAQEFMKNVEAKKLSDEMGAGISSGSEIFKGAARETGEELDDVMKDITSKMDNIHESNVSAKEKEEKYKNLYGQYDIAKILSDLGIPVVSSVLKALEAWRSGDWTAENRASGREFADVTNKLKQQWADGGFKDKISALIDAASGYKKATQNTKMYKSLKATQKAVGEIFITALGIPAGAAPVMLAILGKNAVSNALKDVSDGQVSLDNFSEDDWYVSLNDNSSDTTENEMNDIEITDPNKMEKEVTDFTGYNKGLEEEEKTRKEVPSDFILKVFRKEPKTFGWIRNV